MDHQLNKCTTRPITMTIRLLHTSISNISDANNTKGQENCSHTNNTCLYVAIKVCAVMCNKIECVK